MPNQNDPNQKNQPANVPISPQSDLPPLPLGTPIPPVNPPGQTGSASPPPLSSIISTPKKKFGSGRIIATILGVFLLVGALGAGIYLTQQKQIFQQKAYVGYSPSNTICNILKITAAENPGCEDNCNHSTGKCKGTNDIGSSYSTTYYLTNLTNQKHNVDYGQYAYYCPRFKYGDNNFNCMLNSVESQHSIVLEANQTISVPLKIEGLLLNGQSCGTYQTDFIVWAIDGNSNCTGGQRVQSQGFGVCRTGRDCQRDWTPPTPIPTPTPTPTPPPPSASCLNVKAYSSTWTALTDDQLNKLTPNTVVNFCVTGSSSTTSGGNVSLGGSQGFDKGQFKINGVVKAETTTKRPSSNDFCQSYTILASDKLMDVKARIHHAALNQWFGAIF